MYFVKTVTFIFCVVFLNVFSMEETNKREIKKNENSISPLFGALQRGEFENIKPKFLQFTKKQNREINPETGNTFAMEVLTTYEQKLQKGTFTEQIKLLGIFETYLNKNKHFVWDIKTQNKEGQNFKDIFENVKMMVPLPNKDFLESKDLVVERIVFDENQFKEFLGSKEKSLKSLGSFSEPKRSGSPKLFKLRGKKEKKEKDTRPRRSSSVGDIHQNSNIMSFQKDQTKVILNPCIIGWVSNVYLVQKKISEIEETLNKSVFDDLSNLIRDLGEFDKTDQSKLAISSPNKSKKVLLKRQSVLDINFEKTEE